MFISSPLFRSRGKVLVMVSYFPIIVRCVTRSEGQEERDRFPPYVRSTAASIICHLHFGDLSLN